MLRLKNFHRKMVLHFKEQRISITPIFNHKTTFTRKLALMANSKFNACSITFKMPRVKINCHFTHH